MYPQPGPDQLVGFMHLCFESSNLSALQSAYVAKGLVPTAVKRAGAGNLLFTMRGPEQQNIEYTQYMPGSMHTMDRGLHLGPSRIARQFVGVTLPMTDLAAATLFYQTKLGFAVAPKVAGTQSLRLPGASGEFVQFAPSFRLIFVVPDIKQAARTLKAMHCAIQNLGHALSITDPDGNQVVFLKGTP